jgi:hypothetical protein
MNKIIWGYRLMAKMKFRVKKRTKKDNINVDVDNNIEKYDKDITQEDRTTENSFDDLNLDQDITEEITEKTPKGRKKKRKMKMRFRNPLVKLMKKL